MKKRIIIKRIKVGLFIDRNCLGDLGAGAYAAINNNVPFFTDDERKHRGYHAHRGSWGYT